MLLFVLFSLFALLVPIMILPLYASVRRYGFNVNGYLAANLFAYLSSFLPATLVNRSGDQPWALTLFPVVAILITNAVYHFIGWSSRPDEVERRVAGVEAEEAGHKERLERLDGTYRDWVCLKSYASSLQQYEYLGDRDVLERERIRFTTKQAGITTLFVHPEDADRAAEVLGIAAADAPEPGADAAALDGPPDDDAKTTQAEGEAR